MQNSKWVIHRIGLIDFWYYDEEEFHFLDGRLLLRGANGSGKSVTMQSFIPLLLDGNKASERLDPFGSKARKIENYLLEENDDREERTGYLYMEFKRKENDTFLTIGIGLRGRKYKKLESWYFFLSDGRRVGKDFFLYKDMDHKITLSKVELKNRIGEGGKVFESQKEYMEYVNEQLFGFDSAEEYKELINLLIQLRTPKLSKEFRPTVINEILSNSLQTLSEDDLRPLSEAIENMDAQKTSLDNLLDGKKAADRIKFIYDDYNKAVLVEKASKYKSCKDNKLQLERQLADGKANLNAKSEQLEQTNLKGQALEEEQKILEEQKKNLEKNDALLLREQQLALQQEIEERTKNLAVKEKNLEEKEIRQKTLEVDAKKKQQTAEILGNDIHQKLSEMREDLQGVTFDEHEFMVSELKEEMKKPYGFATIEAMAGKLLDRISTAIDKWKDQERLSEIYDIQLKELEDKKKERDTLEREEAQAQTQLTEVKNELIENLYGWEKNNEELKLSRERLQLCTGLIDRFDESADYAVIREEIRDAKTEYSSGYQEAIVKSEHDLKLQIQEEEEKKSLLNDWMNRKDPEPEKSNAVTRNRDKLRGLNIPFYPFYKVVDFATGIDSEKADRLEEALLEMGILDAIIVPGHYKEKVYQCDLGFCDKYIFADISQVKENISSVLELDNEIDNIILFQELSAVLRGIGVVSGESTFIREDGTYGIGILKGTVTGQYKAKYIGVKAREKYRLEMIASLEMQVNEAFAKRQEIEVKIKKLHLSKEQLEMEFQQFPSGEDLKVAAKECADIKAKLGYIGDEIKKREERAQEIYLKLTQIKQEVVTLCSEIYIKPGLTALTEAFSSIKQYLSNLYSLHRMHLNYIHEEELHLSLCNQIEDLEADLDDIRYELNMQQRKIRETGGKLEACTKQLELTNYSQIKDQLDFCIMRLLALPKEKEETIVLATNLKSEIATGELQNKRLIEEGKRAEQLLALLNRVLQEEYELHYVYSEEKVDHEGTEEIVDHEGTEDKVDHEGTEKQLRSTVYKESRMSSEAPRIDADKIAREILKEYAYILEGKRINELESTLQERVFQNAAALVEYNVTRNFIFTAEDYKDEEADYDKSNFRRIDLLGKYQGKSVTFNQLIYHMQTDIETQKNLLKDSDRELFEEILTNTISKKIRSRIFMSEDWVNKMNALMNSMNTSSGLKLSLKWKQKKGETEEQLDTGELVELLKKDTELMREEEFVKLSKHFRSKIAEARRILEDTGSVQSFYGIIKEVLDYRKWFEFQLYFQKTGEKTKELTNSAFFTFSGGEKAMAMYVPLFSAVVAKYQGARADAPRLISLDEAFAGVDETNIRDMFRLMIEFDFEFIINSQILWGDYDTMPNLAIYQLLRPENAKFVTTIPYIWNGHQKLVVDKIGDE
ncbi:MAG: hypothetical protein K0R21_110 [Anaerocolumna sp.]|jgi:uncharacterized protein (TIGR02680 family)|nr:hypothetical protein [Anaerocolumna sp.]